MATFRELLISLQNLSDVQLDQEIMIIPTGYCSDAGVEIDGYSPFTGNLELAISKGIIVFEDGNDSPQCGSGISGCSDTDDWDLSEDELKQALNPDGGDSVYTVILGSNLPYLRISNKE